MPAGIKLADQSPYHDELGGLSTSKSSIASLSSEGIHNIHAKQRKER